jgi:hypothetical protein
MTSEHRRLEASRERREHWKRWGPYLSERAWGTVREDYSPHGTAWEHLPHDHARSKAYRWNEDGIAGICDRHQKICFAVALWNGRDPILKERLFGLTGNEGNHGEDVKECYYYLDSTPTHSYMKYLYKYPQAAFPYDQLVAENRRRGKHDPEYEITDTGVFNDGRYFDVYVEYAKASTEDILIQVTVANRGPEAARVHVLPTVWFRNTWAWGRGEPRPELHADGNGIELNEATYGPRWLSFAGSPELLFTENETNNRRLYDCDNLALHVKDAFDECVVHGRRDAVNPAQHGTKAAAHYVLDLAPGETRTLKMRLCDYPEADLTAEFAATFAARGREADEFYATIVPDHLSPDAKTVMRQSFGGLLWSKQFYHSTTTSCPSGSTATQRVRRRPASGGKAGIISGHTCTTPMSFRCPTSGSIRGTRRGISRSTASRSRWSIPTSRKSSSC